MKERDSVIAKVVYNINGNPVFTPIDSDCAETIIQNFDKAGFTISYSDKGTLTLENIDSLSPELRSAIDSIPTDFTFNALEDLLDSTNVMPKWYISQKTIDSASRFVSGRDVSGHYRE